MATLNNRLDLSGDETFDANGRAVVSIGPPRFTTQWHITNLAVSVVYAGDPSYPTAKVYLESESPGKLLATTYDATQDSTDMNLTLFAQPGDKVITVFESGNEGDVAHVSIYGEEIIPQGN